MLDRAYATIQFKAVDDAERIIEGVASTIGTDRDGDIMEPAGATFDLPMPFLWQHRADSPIGHVLSAIVGKTGITIRAQIAKGVTDEIDKVWKLIKSGLVRGLSVGFRVVDADPIAKTGGLHIKQWAWFETSAVTIPANAQASIALVKSADAQTLAAFGTQGRTSVHRPGVSGSVRPTSMQNISDKIQALNTERQPKAVRMTEIMQPVVEENAVLTPEEKAEYATLTKEVGDLDEQLERLVALEKASPSAALSPVNGKTIAKASASREHKIEVKGPDLPKGTAWTRYVMALAMSKGNVMQAAEIAKQWQDSTPEVALVLKSAVTAGTTTDATWAGNLVQYQNMASEFVELLRPQTIIGRLNLRRVPFNIAMPAQTAGGTYRWVGQGAAKPVGALATELIQLRFTKAAGIIVLSEELVRFSNPSAEAIVRNDMTAGMAQYLDEQFTDPSVTAVTDVNPASITQGAPNSAAAGTSYANFLADVKEAFASMTSADIPPTGVAILMQSNQAVALGMMRNSLGLREAPDISATGGTIEGLTVVVSDSVPSGHVIYVKQSEIWLADDGGVAIDVSNQASVQMDDTPSAGAQQLVSFWQNNLVGLRAERFIHWKRRRTNAVYYHTSANYGG